MRTDISRIHRFTMGDYTGWQNNIYVQKGPVIKNYPLHWHDYYEIEYIVSGRGRQILNGVEYPILPGVIHFLTPTDFHELIVEEELIVIKFNFQENDIDPFILSTLIGLCGNTSMHFSGKEKEVIDKLLELSFAHYDMFKDSAYCGQMTRKILECILLNIIEHLGKNETNKESNFTTATDNVRKVLTYIHQNFKESLELGTVAESVHYSPQHLSKIFHRTMGVTFKEYITNLRMNYASQLLLNTELGISDISIESGFGTRQNFTKEFKGFYSCSPSEYRVKNKKLETKTSVK